MYLNPTKYLLPLLLLFQSVCVLRAQPGAEPVYIHYSTEEGLPDRTVYHIIQDRQDYMWLATEQGICRFDGYKFWQPPGPEQTKRSAFSLHEDPEGRIWFQQVNGFLWYFERDSIRPWRYNDRLEKYKSRLQWPSGYIISKKSGYIWIFLDQEGILEVDHAGHEKLILPSKGERIPFFFSQEKQVFWTRYIDRKASIEVPDKFGNPKEYAVWQYDNGIWKKIEGFEGSLLSHNYSGAILNGDTLLFYKANEGFYAIHAGRLLWKTALDIGHSDKLYVASTGELFLGMNVGEKGVLHFENIAALRRGVYSQYLKGYAVTATYLDRSGGLWFATHEDGIYHAANLESRVWDNRHGLLYPIVMNLATGKQDDLFLGLRNGKIQCLNKRTGRWRFFPSHPALTFSRDIGFDPTHNRLFVSTSVLIYLEENRWKNINTHKQPISKNITATKISFSSDFTQILCPGINDFYVLKNGCIPKELNGESKVFEERCTVMHDDPLGRRWLSTATKGLYRLNGLTPVSMQNLHPFFKERGPDYIVDLADTLLVFGFLRKGLLIWGPDSQFVHLGPEQGLANGKLNHLLADGKGVLWAGTSQGLSKIFRNDDGQWTIKTFTKAHGLPDLEINDIVADSVGYLWLATAAGLCRFKEPDKVDWSPQPHLIQLVVNGKDTLFDKMTSLYYDQNYVKIKFITLNYRKSGHINYRYRIQSAAKWTYTSNNSVEYASLAPGMYDFEVQSEDEEGRWSDSTCWSFSISPPWWANVWVRMAFLLSGIGFVYMWYRGRLRILEERNSLKQQIFTLERSALQAQMNPHFIFNCLNSIQYFILQNDSQQAMHYLASFSRLVRDTLNASVNGLVSLEEEIRMLRNYLQIEQLRFKNRFQYSIELTEGMNDFDLQFPPLLIQPIVENAILHGVKNTLEVGFIRIQFQEESDYLIVTVTDNGGGMRPLNMQSTGTAHRSVGMDITQKRLSLLSKTSNANMLKMNEWYNESGKSGGMQVELRIRIIEK